VAKKTARNAKTHPKPQGDGGPDEFVPPDRPDRPEPTASAADPELVSVIDRGNPEPVSIVAGDDDAPAAAPARAAAAANPDAEPPVRQARARPAPESDDDEDRRTAQVSRETRARIARERAARNREEALRKRAEAQLAEERAARQATEARLGKLERATQEVAANADLKALESRIKDLESRAQAAAADGDTAKAMSLTIELADLKADYKFLKADLERKAREPEPAARAAAAAPAAAAAADAGGQPLSADELDPYTAEQTGLFKEANGHWWGKHAYQEAMEDAVVFDKQILRGINAGRFDFEPYSEEHFEALAKKLQQAHPDLEINDLSGEPYQFEEEDDVDGNRNDRGRQTPAPRGRAPVGQARSSGRREVTAAELARRGQYTLTDEDRQTMRVFGLDPNKAEDKKAWAKERIRTIMTEARGGA
jgi:hypothetical protein